MKPQWDVTAHRSGSELKKTMATSNACDRKCVEMETKLTLPVEV